jgi:isoleucyl-tRNA synthetase
MSVENRKKNYKDSLNLPRTEFSMKANLPSKEPNILKTWEERDIYNKIKSARSSSEKSFVLHDGPPYANGHLHLGHVLNKTLKDICIKFYSMRGYKTPYVPGWDCHGLPVEHQLLKELKISKHDIDQVKFRKKAYDYAMKFVRIQTEEFKRLGVFADWKHPYLTLTKDYEADILASLADLYERGYIYKDLKPVNWCNTCETALAEAEVEYKNKISPSIFFKFDTGKSDRDKKTFFVVWTTTPWTLIANVAIAVHPDYEYSLVSTGNENWIMLSRLVGPFMEKIGRDEFTVVKRMKGNALPDEYATAVHPFLERESRVVLADYVTDEEGTGCVHTAPGHGQDDYMTGKKYDLPVIMPVDDTGKFNDQAPGLAGKDIFSANEDIISMMKANGSLIFFEQIEHSYPHCWRCKKPIIFRATEQWFMDVDHDGLRGNMLKVISKDVKWVPEAGKDRIFSMVEGRPDWCLSRQRYWGVPIPAFKCNACGNAFTSGKIIRKAVELTRVEGSNIWFEKELCDLAPEGTVCPKCGKKDFLKEGDILDVWFDSGISHKAVLERREDLSFPADVYLEGSDQHRGWFQSSLITSMGMKRVPPYREVLTHGFVVDGEGKKMSKSLGNVISPRDIIKKSGADILRLWTASSDYEGEIKLSDEILARLSDGYRKIRNTFRFLLSNLSDFDPGKDIKKPEELEEIDRWILSQLYEIISKVTDSYTAWEFHRVYRDIYDFCVYEVSAFYLDVVKDTLYVEAENSGKRRSAQTAVYHLLDNICRMLAPIMPFTAEEVWSFSPVIDKTESVHLALWPDPEGDIGSWRDESLNSKWVRILRLRDQVLKVLEMKREKGLIGSSLEAAVVFYPGDTEMREFLEQTVSVLPRLFKISKADVTEEDEGGMEFIPGSSLKIKVLKAPGKKCQRCWNYSEEVGQNDEYPDLCERCYNIVAKKER